MPPDGIYAGWLDRADGDRLPAAISVGTNPTFGPHARRVEAYVLDRDDLELYGEHVCVEFGAYLRPMVTFDDVYALLVQMAEAGTPGFDAVRTVAPDFRKAVGDFTGAIDDAKGPIVRKQRMALKRMAGRVNRRRIDFDALAARLKAQAQPA